MVTVLASGTPLDEHGYYLKGGLDEWGHSYFDLTNEWGYLIYNASGPVPVEDVANAGVPTKHIIIHGATATTTATTAAGNTFQQQGALGTNVNALDQPNQGNAYVAKIVHGSTALTTSAVQAGGVGRAVHGNFEISVATAGDGQAAGFFIIEGASVTLTDTAKQGKPLGGLIFVIIGGSPYTVT